jgi:partner of Y14 and mago protein
MTKSPVVLTLPKIFAFAHFIKHLPPVYRKTCGTANKTKSSSNKTSTANTQRNNEGAMVSEITNTVAGVHLDMDGHRVIGGSQRADGSVRRIVRVRPGFTPTEDIKKINVRELRENREQHVIGVTSRDGAPVRKDQSSFSGLSDLIRLNVAENNVNRRIKSAGDPQPVNQSDAEKGGDPATAERDLSKALANLSVIDDGPPSTEPQRKTKKYVPPRRRNYPLDDSGKLS